ncbi:hypothetical protein ACIPW5_11265 [Streptomyces sp. NPDC090077]|uniref:hypothetical protein n=1 Tax=Streptomyces sp. NPDC090077 TaxID=3365938 RepID=UPI00380CF0C4
MTSEQLALWVPEPCHDGEAPAPQPRTTAAPRPRTLRDRRIHPDAGRAAGGWRRWTPSGHDIHITTVRVQGDLL